MITEFKGKTPLISETGFVADSAEIIGDVEMDDNVSVGHGAVLHECKIRNNVIICMNSTIMDGSEIGENSIIGANALIPQGNKTAKCKDNGTLLFQVYPT